VNYHKDIIPFYFTTVLTEQPHHLLIFRVITWGIISTPDYNGYILMLKVCGWNITNSLLFSKTEPQNT